VHATTFLEDREPPAAPLESTRQTIAQLLAELGRFQG